MGANEYLINSAASGPFPVASEHQVQFFGRDSELADSVCEFLRPGFEPASACVVIATSAHRAMIAARLEKQGFNITLARKRGQFISFDAAAVLRMASVDGQVSAWHFCEVVGGIIARAQFNCTHVRVFGEMGAVLWADGKAREALDVETWWTRLCASYSMSLYCAYPNRLYRNPGNHEQLDAVCGLHSHILRSREDVATGGYRVADLVQQP